MPSWPARELALAPRWGVLLLTDGLIEGRAATGGSARLGMDGLIALLASIRAGAQLGAGALDARRGPHRRGPRAQRRSDARRRRRPAAHGWAERRLMRRSRLSAGTWLALSAGVLAVATLVAIGAALIASHHLTQARQRVVDRVDIATNTALVLTNAMVNQETGVRGFVLGGEEQFLDPYRAGRRERRARPAPAPGAGAGRDGRPPAGRPGGGAARHRRLGVRLRAADDRAHPPLRRGPDRGRRRGGRQGALRCRARDARTDAGRSAGRPRRCARADLARRCRIAHARAGLRGDPAGAGAAGHRDHRPAGHRRAHRAAGSTDARGRLR